VRTLSTASTPVSVASRPSDAACCADGRPARPQHASFGARHAELASEQAVAQRNGDTRRGRCAYTGAPRSWSAHARRGAAARGVNKPRRPQALPLFWPDDRNPCPFRANAAPGAPRRRPLQQRERHAMPRDAHRAQDHRMPMAHSSVCAAPSVMNCRNEQIVAIDVNAPEHSSLTERSHSGKQFENIGQ
jgi:hypothetical protein